MKHHLLALAILLAMSACAKDAGPGVTSTEEHERQSKKYWEQTELVDKQQAVVAEQVRRQERLLQRNEQILDRWEKIQERYERVLTAMEKQHKVQ